MKTNKNIGIAQTLSRMAAIVAVILAGTLCAFSQNSLPAPGSGGRYRPAPVGGGGWGIGPGPGMIGNPGPPPGPAWGSPWGPGWSSSPTIVVNSPSWTNQGTTNVIACGYDYTGIWRTIPLHVAYVYTGGDYTVTVLSAYNPWTDTWMKGLSTPAYNTDYYLRGQTYDFYTNLSTGTYYFNL